MNSSLSASSVPAACRNPGPSIAHITVRSPSALIVILAPSCAGLRVGELVHGKLFNLGEAMSALEVRPACRRILACTHVSHARTPSSREHAPQPRAHLAAARATTCALCLPARHPRHLG